MKKIFLLTAITLAYALTAQETPSTSTTPTTAPAPAPVKADAQSDFDKKFRFGLRINPQMTWLISGDKNNIPKGKGFGFGFGLNFEIRFSEIASFLTGIGGDFENGTYQLKNDPAAGYQVQYWMDEANEFIVPSNRKFASASKVVFLNERRINTTWVTIPLILKLSTKEYQGFKYYGMFGGELAFRAKMTAEDTHYETRRYSNDTTYAVLSTGGTEEDINLGVDASTVPARFGFNAGAGTEYRLGGSTSVFFSINYFRSFTNMMKKESEFMYYKTDGNSFNFVKQKLSYSALRFNIGIMF